MFKQPTQQAICKDCQKEFESKLVFGKWVSRCNDCKSPFDSEGYKRKLAQEARRSEDIKSHDCSKSGCGTVCTAFDW